MVRAGSHNYRAASASKGLPRACKSFAAGKDEVHVCPLGHGATHTGLIHPRRRCLKRCQRVRCSGCGSKGATLQIPSWAGSDIGLAPSPKPRTPRSLEPRNALSPVGRRVRCGPHSAGDHVAFHAAPIIPAVCGARGFVRNSCRAGPVEPIPAPGPPLA
jgi:hypothetical protein